MERVKTGVRGLDEMLNGGFLPETANLLEGAPGTGKTTLGLQFIYQGIVQFQQPGLIVTFEQFPEQYYHDAAVFGWNLSELEQAGKLQVMMTSPEVTLADFSRVGGQIETLARSMQVRRVLIDSLTLFSRLAEDPVVLRNTVYMFINGLRRLGLTSVLTRESSALLGGVDLEDEDLAFVVDSYLMLRYVEIDSAVHRAVLILKHRGSDHDRDIRQYQITGKGFEVHERFRNQEGLMSGSPHRMSQSFRLAFGKSR